jgi:hypothetical protein
MINTSKAFIRTAIIGASAVAALGPAASASADCAAQAENIQNLQAKALSMKSDRNALAVEVEDAGDSWEEFEATRFFGADQKRRADAAKADYEDLKADLATLEDRLQASVRRVNAQVSSFNNSCAGRP